MDLTVLRRHNTTPWRTHWRGVLLLSYNQYSLWMEDRNHPREA